LGPNSGDRLAAWDLGYPKQISCIRAIGNEAILGFAINQGLAPIDSKRLIRHIPAHHGFKSLIKEVTPVIATAVWDHWAGDPSCLVSLNVRNYVPAVSEIA
jgi:hypothetical protein